MAYIKDNDGNNHSLIPIGASDVGAVSYDEELSLTESEKATARGNIGAAKDSIVVKTIQQTLDAQTEQMIARKNIHACKADDSEYALGISKPSLNQPTALASWASDISGGWYIIGKLVVLNMQFKCNMQFDKSTRKVVCTVPTPETGVVSLSAHQIMLAASDDGRDSFQAGIDKYNGEYKLWVQSSVNYSYAGEYLCVSGMYFLN